jgi:hypothetical protein
MHSICDNTNVTIRGRVYAVRSIGHLVREGEEKHLGVGTCTCPRPACKTVMSGASSYKVMGSDEDTRLGIQRY